MKRILQFGMTPNKGGVESFIMNYYRHIDREKVQFDFIDMYGDIAYEKEIKMLGGQIHKIPHFKNTFRYIKELRRVLKKYDTVHINALSRANMLPVLIASSVGVKNIIFHSHNADAPPSILKNILHKANKVHLKKVSHFFSCSDKASKWMFNAYSSKAVIINNAIDIDKYAFKKDIRDSYRKELKLEGRYVIGHVGRFQYQKNHVFLIKIFKNILEILPDSVLILVGDGEEKEKVYSQLEDWGILDSVIFMGIRDDVPYIMQAIDTFILPSHFEGQPVVSIEAQAAGLPSFLSSKITEEAKLTDLVTYLNLDEKHEYWAKSIMENKNYSPRIKYAKKITEANYDIKSEAKKLESFYLQLKR